jgi:hypothetical protein
MSKTLRIALAGCVALALAGCENGGPHDVDSGGVLLRVSNFDGLPLAVSVSSSAGLVTIDSITLSNIVANPNSPTTDLQSIQVRQAEITFRRRDTGQRLPPPFIETQSLFVPVGSTATLLGLPILRSTHLSNLPLSDLANFGRDTETGSSVILLDITVRFFGQTVSGRDIASEPFSFTVEFRP